MRRRLALAAAAALVLWIPVAPAAAPFMTGVVEGYYGRPWTGDARRDVLRFLGAHGLNTFVYGPKNDPYHRDEWRAPYPDDSLADLAATARVAKEAKVRFVYALSPALDICYACPDERRILKRKLRQLVRARVRRFALFFDDAPTTLTHPEDVARYGGSGPDALARAHAELVRGTNAWLERRGLPRLVLMVPTDYFGTACSPYLAALDAALPRSVPVGWTGTAVVAPTVAAAEATARRSCLGNRPLVLWDNYPVNDVILSSNLHLGPFTGRAADLGPALGGGHLLNPMTQAHASLVALGTAAAYFADPAGYDAEAAWRTTLTELAPVGSLDVLAEQTRSSALDLDDARALAAVVDDLATTYGGDAWPPAADALDAELARQRDAATILTGSFADTPLGREVGPWVAELQAHLDEADRVRTLLRAMKPGLSDLALAASGAARRLTGRVALPDVAAAAQLGPLVAAPRPIPDLLALQACLGPLLAFDINFCPQLGLNVHGKRLYLALTNPIALVTGRNQHERLMTFAAAAWTDWAARQSPSPSVTLTVNDLPVTLGGDGAFDVLVPAAGPVSVTATSDAGDVTTVAF